MSLKKKNQYIFKTFEQGISFRIASEKFSDSQNVYTNKNITETRPGIARFNSTSLGGPVLSLSYFKTNDGDRYRLAKVGTVLYAVAASGAHASVKTGLTATTKHRAVTLDSRHIIAIETDGLFSWDGTTFTQLGQSPPTTLSVAIAAGGSLAANNDYQVAISFYASTIGFESNALESSIISTTADKTIDVSDIPATADNALIDFVRIYLKDVEGGGSYAFVDEIALGTTTYSITAEPTSTQTIQTTHGAPLAGGAKYLTVYGKKIAYTGNNSFKSDVFISEDFLPDAFDDTSTSRTIAIEGQGPVTGIACGTYSDTLLDPYIVAFKKTSTTLYSDLGGISRQVLLDPHIGCVSNDTIKVVNGVIHFLSENGWYMIENGVLVKKDGKPFPLAAGDIDDIFARSGWAKELNKAQFSNYFSVVYPTHRQYWTFIAEGSESTLYKAYIYERDTGGFRFFKFNTNFKCATEAEDEDGNQVVLLGDTSGRLFSYAVGNDLHDVDASNASSTIETFLALPFFIEKDLYASYNYRFLTIRGLTSSNAVTVRTSSNWISSEYATDSLDFASNMSEFTLDVSMLDVDAFGEERSVRTATIDLNTTAETIMVKFYQNIMDANIGLISGQLQYSKNGGNNL